jgi:hypothetical protein
VHSSIAQDYAMALAARAERLPVGDPSKEQVALPADGARGRADLAYPAGQRSWRNPNRHLGPGSGTGAQIRYR